MFACGPKNQSVTDLAELIGPLQREVAIPGTFGDTFPSTSDEDLVATLADGFAEAQLQGFFTDMTLEITEGVETTYSTDKDLSAAGGALVVLFAAQRLMRPMLTSSATGAKYKAGPVEYETSSSAMVIREVLRQFSDRISALITDGKRSGRSVSVLDSYAQRIASGRTSVYGLGGFHDYEWRG